MPEKKTVIYLTAAKGGFRDGDYIAYALAEDGRCLATHLSSSLDWAKHDIGLTSEWQRDLYAAAYPDGYELVWIDEKDQEGHEGFQAAYKLNQEKYQEAQDG